MGKPRIDRFRIFENQPFVLDFLKNDDVAPGEYAVLDLPSWMSLDAQGRIVGTYNFDSLSAWEQPGTTIYYRLTDGTVQSDVALILVTIVGRNDAPVFDPIPRMLVATGSDTGTVIGQVTATDVDRWVDVPMVYSLTDDAGGRYAINSATGAISLAEDADSVRRVDRLTVQVVDEFGGRDLVRFTVSTLAATDDDGFVFVAGPAPALLEGTDGGDRMIDRRGVATLAGGKGDDVYVLAEDANGNVGTVQESAGGGADTIIFKGTAFTLPDEVENLAFHGTGGLGENVVYGNALDNVMRATVAGSQVSGGAGNDRLIGTSGEDFLYGGAGNDVLDGRGSDGARDLLQGDAGDDRLIADDARMYGGTGADMFIYRRGTGETTIYDFDPGEGDRISLVQIDADVSTERNDRFTFIGEAAFTGSAGEVRYTVDIIAETTTVEADTNGDGQADMAIYLPPITSLSEASFIL